MASFSLALTQENNIQRSSFWRAPRREKSSLRRDILKSVLETVAALEPAVQERVLPLLQSLAGERDSAFLLEELLQVGVLMKSEGQEAVAGLLLQRLSQDDVPSEIRKRAELEYGGMVGNKSSALRVEYLFSRVMDDNALRAIAPMIGVTAVGQIVGTALLGGLARTTFSRFLARGWGRNLAANLGSLAVEVPTLVGLTHLVSPRSSGASLGDEFLSSALNLGVFRFCGWLGTKTSLPLASHGSLFLGLSASRRLEEHFHLRPVVEGATRGVDVLGDMAHMLIGSGVGKALLGRPWAAFHREMEVRSNSFIKFGEPKKDLRTSVTGRVLADAPRSSLPIDMSLALGGNRRVLPVDIMKFAGPKKPRMLEMSQEGDSGGLDSDLAVDQRMNLYYTGMFIEKVRHLKGDPALALGSKDLDNTFLSIDESARLFYALEIADILLTDPFLHFQKMRVFPTLTRHLTLEKQLNFAGQLYDKIELVERTASDLEPHAEQLASIFGDLHSENFLPFLSKVQRGLRAEESRRFAEACLKKIGSG